MGQNFSVTIPPPKLISARQECDLLRQAVAQNPASMTLKQRLATLLVDTDQFDEAIPVLMDVIAIAPDCSSFLLLARTLFARRTLADDHDAALASQSAVDVARDCRARARAFVSLGRAQVRLGLREAALETLTRAMGENEQDRMAFYRLAKLYLDAGNLAEVIALASGLRARGVCHAQLLAFHSIALAQLGDLREVRKLIGLDQFLCRSMMQPPAGWTDLQHFHHDLAAELSDHPSLHYGRDGSASEKTWRIDEPSTGKHPCVAALQKQIVDQVTGYAVTLSDAEHPWAKSRPIEAQISNWCVITESEGYEEWHMHPDGWLSGVYYVDVPAHIGATDDHAGHLAFGLPEHLAGAEAATRYGVQLVRPQPGLLMMFPSHNYHRTFPHHGRARRICFAFDICPR